MKPRSRYKPYIRRANGKERSESLREAYRLAYFSITRGKNFFVMVQRGFPNLVIASGLSRVAIKRGLLAYEKSVDFDRWANIIKRRARG
jgi:hypothetical protein